MATAVNAKVIMAKCSQTQRAFGIRIEQRGAEWVRTWTFPLDEGKARREGYSAKSTVLLRGEPDSGYPGCPHCRDGGIVQCACGKIGCAGGVQETSKGEKYSCPWCGNEGELEFSDSLDVAGGSL